MLGNGKKNIGFDSNFYTNKSDAPVYNPATITADFKARVIANGGTITSTQETACLNLVTNLVNNNLWSKMLIIYPFVGGTAASCAVNLVSSNYKGTFSSGWTFTALGGTPNGANTFMLANDFNPFSLLPQFDTSFSYYSRTNNTTNGAEIGIQQIAASPDNRILSLSYFSGNAQAALNSFPTGTIILTAPNRTGLWLISRKSNIDFKYYRNGSQIGTTNTDIETAQLPNAILNYATLSFNDGINYISTNRQCAFAHAGTGLTSAETTLFYNNVQTFQTALSRQV